MRLMLASLVRLVLVLGVPLIGGAQVSHERPLRVMVELADPPVAPLWSWAHNKQAAAAQLARIEQRQQQLMPMLHGLGAQVVSRMQRVFNGVSVLVAANQLPVLARLPGVVAVRPAAIVMRHNSTSVPYIGAPALWSSPQGLTGKNRTIGIIDTGIDYLHTDFGGPGTGYGANNSAIVEPGSFPTAKVVGGTDFVGNRYDATSDDPAQLVPQPDPDPLDCNGHGTHVAGTAAGMGVNADGTTYTGPYHADLPFASFKIGPGVAPEASLYALKVFGCGGSATSDDVMQAIEYAVDPNGDGDLSDHLDVINMSLGASGGGALDSQSIASNNAALAGVIVATSAGNDGDAFYISGSPGNAQRVISVAASGDGVDTLASFSARGPGQPGSHLKPDIAAPGVGIVSADSGSGTEATALSGTSMAAPHLAGSMALLRQLHPDWTVEQLKALVINTAVHDIFTSPAPGAQPYGPGRVGAGRVDLAQAAGQPVIAYNADGSGTVSVSFGSLEVTQTLTLVKQITVANKGTAAATFDIAYQAAATIPGVTYTMTPARVTLLPSQQLNVRLSLRADPAQMQHTHDPTISETQYDVPRHWLSEATGYLLFTAPFARSPAARLPVYAAAGPASQMHSEQAVFAAAGSQAGTSTISLAGMGLQNNEAAIITAYELAYTSPLNGLDAIGRNADLRYIGVASDFKAAGGLDATMLYIGIATFGDWASPHQVEFDVLIDTNRDGIDDFALMEWNAGSARGKPISDAYTSVLINLRTGAPVNNNLHYINLLPATSADSNTPAGNTVPFNTNVIMLPVAAADLGLRDGAGIFNYRVETWSTDRGDTEFSGDRVIYGSPVDITPVLTYNAARPGFDFATGNPLRAPLFADQPNTAIHFAYDPAAAQANGTQGLLLFHHHNSAGSRTEIIPGARVALPLIMR